MRKRNRRPASSRSEVKLRATWTIEAMAGLVVTPRGARRVVHLDDEADVVAPSVTASTPKTSVAKIPVAWAERNCAVLGRHAVVLGEARIGRPRWRRFLGEDDTERA